MKKLIKSTAIATCISAATPASAAIYTIDFTLESATGTATLTTAGDATVNPSLVTALTGTYNGLPLTLLSPDSYLSNDNLFEATSPFFDIAGISFEAGGLLPVWINLYSGQNVQYYCSTRPPDTTCGRSGVATVALRETSGVVPEPATWAMMLLGFGAIGLRARKARRRIFPEPQSGLVAHFKRRRPLSTHCGH